MEVSRFKVEEEGPKPFLCNFAAKFYVQYFTGKGFGALVSGFLIAAYGCRITLQIFGVMYVSLLLKIFEVDQLRF